MMFWPTTTPLPFKPLPSFTASIWNGAFGMPADCACVSVTGWPLAVRPPHAGGSTASSLPSKSRCGW